ncbi:MAG TPA: hypothetical protein PKA53_01060 [Sphingobacterium sp.]|nr:hypothetical protein [Sphingobacterium sp.]
MNKYTIKKVFEKTFPFPIWKIEADCTYNNLVIEYRDPNTTLPYFSIVDFNGESKCSPVAVDEKEWTLEALQGDFLILKRFGGSSPIEAGIRIIHYPTGQTVCYFMEYVLQDVYQDIVLAKHRAVPNGLKFAIEIATGEVNPYQHAELHYPFMDIKYPLTYPGNKPLFMAEIPYIENIWLLSFQDIFIWAYHLSSANKYDLYLSLSSKTEILDSKMILKGLDRLIPQPFFQVKGYIFFLSNTKLKITTYLV